MMIMIMIMHFNILVLFHCWIWITHKFFKLMHYLSISFIFIYFWNLHFEFRRMSREHNMWTFNWMTLYDILLKYLIYILNWISTSYLRMIWGFLIFLEWLFYICFFFLLWRNYNFFLWFPSLLSLRCVIRFIKRFFSFFSSLLKF
jgi:hypothetical protein